MDQTFQDVLQLNDDCLRLAESLIECFERERLFLVQFQTEGLLQNNLDKEGLLFHLTQMRTSLRDKLDNLGELSPEYNETWERQRTHWVNLWDKLRRVAIDNQSFLKHSLKNLDQLAENLKRLYQDRNLYSRTGNTVDNHFAGQVVEGKF